MIKQFVIIGMCCIGFLANAQYDSKGDNVSRYRPGAFWFYTGVRPAKPERQEKYDRLIMDITYNDWVGDEGPFENNWASIGLNTSLMFDIPMSRKSDKVSFGVGVSYQFTNIRHNNLLLVDDINKTTIFATKGATDTFEKGILAGNSFSIPIEFRFRTSGWKHFKFHIGGKIGYQANLLSKYVSKVDGHREVVKRFGFPDESKLIYSAHIRIGMRNWALFASYNFNPIFSNSKSTQLNMVQAGISISLF